MSNLSTITSLPLETAPKSSTKMPKSHEDEAYFDGDDATIIESLHLSSDSGSDTETETPFKSQSRTRRDSIASQYSNTGAQKGLASTDWNYLKDADEEDDIWSLLNISDTFFRDHYSSINPPERWISIQDFLDAETASGKVTDCGEYLKGLPAKVELIEAEASRLRNGLPCRLNVKYFNKGAFNIVLKVEFEDNEIWVLRIQVPEVILFTEKQRAAHEDTQLKALKSQLGSMRYVRENTKIPVPEIFGYDFSNRNAAGAPYMFMELIQGMSVKKWLEENSLTKEKATEFYGNLAEIMWEFYQTRFDKIGELQFDSNGKVTVGGFFDSRTRSTYGPFTSAHQFLTARQQKLWEFRVLAERRKTEIVGLGYKHWNELNREVKDIFTAWLYRKAAAYAQMEYETVYPDSISHTSSNDTLPDNILFHADLSINNLLVDEDLKIIAVIDWDWTASLPKSSFDPLPFDMGYDTPDQFPGNVREHEVFDHKEVFYSLWKTLETQNDPQQRLGESLITARIGKNSIATILNRYAWTYCIERTCLEIFERLKDYEEDSCCWRCLIGDFRQDWIDTKRTWPNWLEQIIKPFRWGS
jgi:hypothetical protein